MKPSSHARKFKKWQQSVCRQTRFLSELVDTHLVAFFENAGFHKVDITLYREDQGVSMDQIELERVSEGKIDCVHFSFAKHGAPGFQIGFSSRQPAPPHDFLTAGRLVKKTGQHYHIWGKPGWIPLSLWPDKLATAAVAQVLGLCPQILHFLDDGVIGPNIGSALPRAQSAAASRAEKT